MESDLCEKVDISRIEIERVDGLPSKARVSSIEAANRVLDSWADSPPESGAGECDFQIVFEDGFRYRGHYRLNKSQKRISLSRYVRKQLTALASAKNVADLVKASGLAIVGTACDDPAESARIALAHYNI